MDCSLSIHLLKDIYEPLCLTVIVMQLISVHFVSLSIGPHICSRHLVNICKQMSNNFS